jgi:hypothetical protein
LIIFFEEINAFYIIYLAEFMSIKNCSLFRLQNVGLTGGNPYNRIRRTDVGYGTLITIEASIMPYLQEHGTIAKRVASFGAYSASNTQLLIHCVLIIWIFHIRSLNCKCGAFLVFCAGAIPRPFWQKQGGTEIAITAHSICMDTFYRRWFQYARICAFSTVCA